MLLHWSFCAEWFDSKFKRNSKIHLKKKCFGIKEKKKLSLSLLSRGRRMAQLLSFPAALLPLSPTPLLSLTCGTRLSASSPSSTLRRVHAGLHRWESLLPPWLRPCVCAPRLLGFKYWLPAPRCHSIKYHQSCYIAESLCRPHPKTLAQDTALP